MRLLSPFAPLAGEHPRVCTRPRVAPGAWAVVGSAPTGQRAAKRYPTPRTVWSQRGTSGFRSILVRSRRTCSVTVASCCHSTLECHTSRSSW